MSHLQLSMRPLMLTVVLFLTTPSAPGAIQSCGPCLNSNYVAYNRCGYWSIDDVNLGCQQDSVQDKLFRLNSATRKASYRFTLSPALVGSQTITSVWIRYRTPAAAPRCLLSLRADSNGQPSPTSLNSTLFIPQWIGAAGWQQVALTSPVTGLTPGSIYHIVLEPQGNPDVNKYIEMSVDRGRVPVHYHPTDALGSAMVSPCDRWLAIMNADTSKTQSPGFYKEAAANKGFSPIFAVELVGTGLYGDPYDELIERTIWRNNEYGQSITLTTPTDVNYVAFWTRAFGDAVTTCPNYCPNTCPVAPLEFDLVSAANPTVPIVTATIPHGMPVYRSRPHWMGVFFDQHTLPPGTYYLVLKAMLMGGTSSNGWVFSATNSTLPLNESQVPTYQRGASYAVESNDGGTSFHPLKRDNGAETKNADTAFMLGNFPDGPCPIGMACDQGVSVPCGSGIEYAKLAAPGDVITIGVQCFNSGVDNGALQYTRLLDLNCAPVSPVYYTPAGSPNMHTSGGTFTYTMGPSNLFLWFESGHQDVPSGALVPDEMFPIEVTSNACNSCTCP